MQKLKSLFIINPISGVGKQKTIPELIARYLDKNKFIYEIVTTEYAGHAAEIASQLSSEYDIMVAAGGDGTVNEVAGGLIDKSAALGVIPLGSGNGFARHFEVPMQSARAIQELNRSTIKNMDTGLLNDKPFFNVSGIGFDGQISKIFAEQMKRGYITYAKCVMEELQSYHAKNFRLIVDGKEWEDEYFLVAFANTTQYGNNAIIAPKAITNDGLLEIVLVKPFPSIYLPAITMMTLFRNLHHSPYVDVIRASSATLFNPEAAPIHVDGEYVNNDTKVKVVTKNNSLKIFTPL